MGNREKSILYSLLGIYAIMISWYYNHNLLLVIFHFIIWPVYLIYELLLGHLAHDMWRIIPESYFK
jgi:hypothetical protein